MTDQQYELKCGVFHYPSLKTVQLIEFLENQANQFLHNDLPQYIKTQQKFIAIIQSFQNNHITDINFQEYVGIVIIYSTSSLQSFQYAKQKVQKVLQQSDVFIIIVEMDNSDKQANTIGDQGQKYCQRSSLPFVRLSLYSSDDLIMAINKNLYQLVQNYYYPNEEERPSYSGYSQNKIKNGSLSNNDEYILSYDSNQKIIATKDQKNYAQNFLNYASKLRQSRQKQIQLEQKVLDESIDNVEKVLNNINNRIKQKLESNWFTTLKDTLYLPVQKSNQNFSKIKLSQEFIDEKKQKSSSRYYSDHNQNNHNTSYLNKTSANLPINFTQLQKPSVMKFVIFFSEENIAQIEVFQNSTYQELGLSALKKLGLNQSQKNLRIIIQKIKLKIQTFIKELQKGIKSQQQRRIQERTFLRGRQQIQRDP